MAKDTKKSQDKDQGQSPQVDASPSPEGFPEAAKKDWKEHFPQAADQHRKEGTRSPDEERAAQRTQNRALEHQEQQAQNAARENEPVPTGEENNPHKDDQPLDKDSPAQPPKP